MYLNQLSLFSILSMLLLISFLFPFLSVCLAHTVAEKLAKILQMYTTINLI